MQQQTVVTQKVVQGGTVVQAPVKAGDPYVVRPPQTAAELRALKQKRSELDTQIRSVQSRRERVADQLREADPAARAGLQARLAVLDDRIVQLEKDLDVTGEALRNASVETLAASQGPNPADIARTIASDAVPIVAIVTIFVFAPITLAITRFIWRRGVAPSKNQQAMSDASQQRLDQLQDAVDTIAIEVERIAEGQRYVTKLLKDKSEPHLGISAENG